MPLLRHAVPSLQSLAGNPGPDDGTRRVGQSGQDLRRVGPPRRHRGPLGPRPAALGANHAHDRRGGGSGMKPEDMLLRRPSPGDHPKRYFPEALCGTPPRSLGAPPGSRGMVQERFRSCLLRIKAPSKPGASSHKRRIRDEPDHIRAHRNDSSYDGSLARGPDGGFGLAGPLTGLSRAAGCPPYPPGPTPRGGGGGPWGATAAPSLWHLLRGLEPDREATQGEREGGFPLAHRGGLPEQPGGRSGERRLGRYQASAAVRDVREDSGCEAHPSPGASLALARARRRSWHTSIWWLTPQREEMIPHEAPLPGHGSAHRCAQLTQGPGREGGSLPGEKKPINGGSRLHRSVVMQGAAGPCDVGGWDDQVT